jgi:tripeptidyl-peptidase-1
VSRLSQTRRQQKLIEVALYNIPKGTKATPGNELGIFEDLGDVFAQEDLDAFFTLFAPYIKNGTQPKLDLIDGAVAPVAPAVSGLESALDFDIAYPIIYPQNAVLFQTDDPVYENNYTFQGFLNNFFDAIDGSYCSFYAFGEKGNSPADPPYPNPSNAPGAYKGQLQCGVYKPTPVISISYGGAEADLPINYQRRQCTEIMKLGLQGVSVINSSGDSGVEGRGGDPTPSNCLGKDNNVFAPQFPATCPYG